MKAPTEQDVRTLLRATKRVIDVRPLAVSPVRAARELLRMKPAH